MSYTKTLLAGAALCALCTAPALARTAPGVHLATSGLDSPSKLIHSKTNIASGKNQHVTLTYSFSASLTYSADFKVPIQFIQYTWQNTLTCLPPVHEFLKIIPHRTDIAKIRVGSVTGPTSACPFSTFTFYGPLYELKHKGDTSDSFAADLKAKNYSGYNYTLNENWSINIGA